MIVTVTNTSGRIINDLDRITVGEGIVGLVFEGGARKDPLPYPFGHVGAVANGASVALPMHPRDFHFKESIASPMDSGTEWQQLVQAGTVTFAVAAETGVTDLEEVALAAI